MCLVVDGPVEILRPFALIGSISVQRFAAMMLYYTFLFWLTQLPATRCATSAQWRSRSIYQVMTDRYALANMSTTAPCDTAAGLYCGGTYDGITKNLDCGSKKSNCTKMLNINR